VKLDQTCPHCGTTEALGDYCTKCFKTTKPEWVHKPRRGQSREILEKGANRPKESAQVKP
jgi:methionyl-tRNA synthetase